MCHHKQRKLQLELPAESESESEPEGEQAYNDEQDNGQGLPYFSRIVARIPGLLQK